MMGLETVTNLNVEHIVGTGGGTGGELRIKDGMGFFIQQIPSAYYGEVMGAEERGSFNR